MTLAEYAEAIVCVRNMGDWDVRVRVTPAEQARLIPLLAPDWGDVIADYEPHVFLRNVLGAREWVWDNTITGCVIEPIL